MDAFMVGVHNRFVRATDDAVPFIEGEFVVHTIDSSGVAEEIFQEEHRDWMAGIRANAPTG